MSVEMKSFSFDDEPGYAPAPIRDVGRQAVRIDPEALILFESRFRETFGRNPIASGQGMTEREEREERGKARSIFESFERRYGKDMAMKIVVAVFEQNGGMARDEVISMQHFSKGMSWFTDRVRHQVWAREESHQELARRDDFAAFREGA